MIVFKNYFKILKSNKIVIILYTSILLVFTLFGITSGDTAESFKATKPDVVVINHDIKSNITDNFIKYIENNANIVEIDEDEKTIEDALFYRNINAVIYVYNGYTNDYLMNNEKEIEAKFTTDYNASYMKMLLERYLKIASISNDYIKDEQVIIETINNTLEKSTEINLDTSIDTSSLDKAAYYYNFANYSMLAICIYIIAVVMNTFNRTIIKKRNAISSKKISSFTKELYLGNLVFAFIVWLMIVLFSVIIIGDAMFTTNGLLLIVNSFVFMLVALGIGFLVGSILKNTEAINGLTNVLALGSSFLCGSFVPIEFMPDSVISAAKALPSYWYIANNNLLKGIEVFDKNNTHEFLMNLGIMFLYVVACFLITMIYNKTHRKEK